VSAGDGNSGLRLHEGGVVAVAVSFLKERAKARSSLSLTEKANTAAPRRYAGTPHISSARRPLSSASSQERDTADAASLGSRHTSAVTRHPRTVPRHLIICLPTDWNRRVPPQ
jgi:hypothetical protein